MTCADFVSRFCRKIEGTVLAYGPSLAWPPALAKRREGLNLNNERGEKARTDIDVNISREETMVRRVSTSIAGDLIIDTPHQPRTNHGNLSPPDSLPQPRSVGGEKEENRKKQGGRGDKILMIFVADSRQVGV